MQNRLCHHRRSRPLLYCRIPSFFPLKFSFCFLLLLLLSSSLLSHSLSHSEPKDKVSFHPHSFPDRPNDVNGIISDANPNPNSSFLPLNPSSSPPSSSSPSQIPKSLLKTARDEHKIDSIMGGGLPPPQSITKTTPISRHSSSPSTPTSPSSPSSSSPSPLPSSSSPSSSSPSSSTYSSHPPHVDPYNPDRITWMGREWRLVRHVDDPPPWLDPSSVSNSEFESIFTPRWNLFVICSMVCVTLAALAAGLTVGLVSIDPLDLSIILHTDPNDLESEEEKIELENDKRHAKRLLPLVQRHHLLLVTLLLLNSIANECLPLFLDRLVPSYLAVILSVTFVLIFGEILPSAIFTGQNQLKIASAMSPIVYVGMFLFFAIAYPIAWLLDRILGHDEVEKYRRGELKALVRLQGDGDAMRMSNSQAYTAAHSHTHSPLLGPHKSSRNMMTEREKFDSNFLLNNPPSNGILNGKDLSPRDPIASPPTKSQSRMSKSSPNGPFSSSDQKNALSFDEITIIHGALEMKNLTVSDVMVPLKEVYMLPMEGELDYDTLADILSTGHSRIPIYDGEKKNIKGILMVKKLIVLNPEGKRKIRSLGLRRPLVVMPNCALLDLLNLFQEGRSHMAIITNDVEEVHNSLSLSDTGEFSTSSISADTEIYGIVTIEDVIERLIKEEITDESDRSTTVREALASKEKGKRRIALLRSAILQMQNHQAKVLSPPIERVRSNNHLSNAMANNSLSSDPSTSLLKRVNSNPIHLASSSSLNNITITSTSYGSTATSTSSSSSSSFSSSSSSSPPPPTKSINSPSSDPPV